MTRSLKDLPTWGKKSFWKSEQFYKFKENILNTEDLILPVFDQGLRDGGEVGGRVGHLVVHRVAQSEYKSLTP